MAAQKRLVEIGFEKNETTVFPSGERVALINRDERGHNGQGRAIKRRGSGSQVVNANWNPDDRQLNVNANDSGNANDNLGLRLSRSLFHRCSV